MRTTSLTRWLGAVSVTAALLLVTAPNYASATPQPTTIRPYLSGITISPGGDNTGRSSSIGFDVTGLGNTEVNNVAVTLDTSKLPVGATLTVSAFGWNCTTSTGSIACSSTTPLPTFSSGGAYVYLTAYLFVQVAAASDAPYGVGSLTVSATADGLTGSSTTVPVGIAQPVTLSAGPITSFSGPPGSTYSAQWSVTNAGAATVHGVRLWIDSDAGFDLTKRYSNCLYSTEGAGAVCTFDNDLAPGETYQVSEPVSVKIAADHMAPFLGATTASWLTPLDLSTYQIVAGTPGAAGPLNLVVQSSQAPAPPLTQAGLAQTDAGFTQGSYVDVSVSGVNSPGLTALGASVRSHGNDTVQFTVGITNQGPATASMNRSGDPLSVVTVTIPSGTTATSVPIGCWPYVSGQADSRLFGIPGYGQYDCVVYQNLAVHENYLLSFALQVPATARGYSGSVTISNAADQAGSVAPITVTLTPSAPTSVAPTGRRPTGVPSWGRPGH